MLFALAGNQNCGKTTLFNQLTGSNQHVGNFPGVTVESKEGVIRGHSGAKVVDLPGIYSLSPYTNEEIVTRDFLLEGHPDAIINIVDATNLERNLYLSMQLLELNIPMVIALNMMDEIRANDINIKIPELAHSLGVPVVPISAAKNEGIAELIETAVSAAKNSRLAWDVRNGNSSKLSDSELLMVVKHHEQHRERYLDFCVGPVHRAIHSVAHLVEDHAQRAGVPPRFAATKLVEGDPIMLERLALSDNEKDTLEHSVTEMERELGTDREAALADMRYTFIEQLCAKAVVKHGESREHLRSVKMDELLTHKYFAIPIFLLIMLTIFWLTFGVFGSFFSDQFSGIIDRVSALVSLGLIAYGINPVVHSLVIDGVFAGVGSVLSFLPTIVVLFFFLSILEDSGYMARVAFVMDKLLRKLGLSGRSFVPMLIGFGCSVPAIMATRTLSSERDRKMTILLTPFMSCSAKLPIYAMFTMAFFPGHSALVMITLYAGGMLVGIISGLLLKNTAFKGKPVPFVMELPNYRLPSPKSVGLLLWDKAKDFLTRAFTVIFIASLAIWFLQTFDTRFNLVPAGGEASMLASIGRFISPIFTPLGFSDWRASTALLTGFSAKEAVVSTLAVLTGASVASLPAALAKIFSPAAACAFLAFTLLYTPCVAAIAAVRRELDTRHAVLMSAYQTGVAWVVAFLVYRVALLII